jgi:hypothetical protein
MATLSGEHWLLRHARGLAAFIFLFSRPSMVLFLQVSADASAVHLDVLWVFWTVPAIFRDWTMLENVKEKRERKREGEGRRQKAEGSARFTTTRIQLSVSSVTKQEHDGVSYSDVCLRKRRCFRWIAPNCLAILLNLEKECARILSCVPLYKLCDL